MNDYLDTAREIYREAAINPQPGLCCTTSPVWRLPGLQVPAKMLDMNYGCGSTVHPGDLVGSPSILYVGVGGGMELLQFAYFSRRAGAVIGLDVVDEMLSVCQENLIAAETLNPWFRRDFIELRNGDALALPINEASIDVAAQNCLFNIFHDDDLKTALSEMYRVLRPGGRLLLSDPICEVEIPRELRNDEQLRAQCLTGALPLTGYIKRLTDIGFGTVEVRARRPYRVLSPHRYRIEKVIPIESMEVCAIKDPIPKDGPCIFTGQTAIYHGSEELFDDKKGHILFQNQPLSVCDKTASALMSLGRADIFVSQSTWFYGGGGCC